MVPGRGKGRQRVSEDDRLGQAGLGQLLLGALLRSLCHIKPKDISPAFVNLPGGKTFLRRFSHTGILGSLTTKQSGYFHQAVSFHIFPK